MAPVMQLSLVVPAPQPCMCRWPGGHSSGEAAQAPRAPGASAALAEARAERGIAVSENNPQAPPPRRPARSAEWP